MDEYLYKDGKPFDVQHSGMEYTQQETACLKYVRSVFCPRNACLFCDAVRPSWKRVMKVFLWWCNLHHCGGVLSLSTGLIDISWGPHEPQQLGALFCIMPSLKAAFIFDAFKLLDPHVSLLYKVSVT